MRRTLALFSCICLLTSGATQAQSTDTRSKAIVLKRMIEQYHFSPRAVDDSFSVLLFKAMIEATDPRRLLFTAPEYQQLQAFSTRLDDELQGKSWAFLDVFTIAYKKALTRADSIINKTLQKPFDFTVNETVSSSKGEQYNFAADRAALENRWSRYLKFMIMDQVYDKVTADSARKTTFRAALVSAEPSVREKLKQAELKSLKKALENPAGAAGYTSELYLNAIASVFDPHSNYFSPEGKEEFQAQLSTEAFSFGLDLEENEDGKILIDRLAPGGPAWKTGELNKGDELIRLQWEGKEAVEMKGLDLEEAYALLEQSAHDRLVFEFRKPDGAMRTVLLRKEKINNEENIVKGFVLKGEKKIGYILLPGFYTEWENETGSSCANDVAKEIVKLRKENIDGLILDVRFNGGGSIGEAIEMIGIFIEEGPLGAEKSREGKQVTFKDPNRGTIFDGPMVLMVNGQSASASEMLAASLQDYNRAVIVGSNTFGKATMQQMLQLDTFRLKPYTGRENTDIVKITMKKLYRLDGRSAQLNGVAPDIILPDAFDGMNYREKYEKNALPSDMIKPNPYYHPLTALPVSELARRSSERLAASTGFQQIKKIIAARQKVMDLTVITIPLKWDSFEKWEQQQELQLETEGEGKTAQKYTVDNHAQDKQLLHTDAYASEMNKAWLQRLASDIYIQEAFLVLTDLLQIQKTTSKN